MGLCHDWGAQLGGCSHVASDFFFFGRLKGDWLKVSTTLRAAAGAIAHCADGL